MVTATLTRRADCHACQGTGTDTAFGGECSECERDDRASVIDAARFGHTPEHTRPLPSGSSTSTGTTSSRRPTPAAVVEGQAEAELVDWLREQRWSTFAQSLAADYMRRGYLTPKQHASASSMKAKCDARAAERAEVTEPTTTSTGTTTPPPDVAEGHYAIESPTGLAFYNVQRPDAGRWAGYVFVRRVIGGQPDTNVRGSESRRVLEAIAADADAGPRYGREIGRCCRCNRTLTDAESRAAGIGPFCRNK